ncbi:MAG: chorismate synthase [bacterium]
MLRYLTAGESHGKALTAIVEGMPSGLKITEEKINEQLARRQKGYGRGGRMKIERDKVEILSGVRLGETLGSPITLQIKNKDWENWQEIMRYEPGKIPDDKLVLKPRPGHADLPGFIKYNHSDVRNILERASARETAMRVAVGAVARIFLAEFGIKLASRVTGIAEVKAEHDKELPLEEISRLTEQSEVRCLDPEAEKLMIERIKKAQQDGDSLGGVFEVLVDGLPVGLGSYVHWDRRLDASLAEAVMSIQAIKGVEIGQGFTAAASNGSEVHDQLYFTPEKGVYRLTNNAGGLEGGMTNGERLVVRAAMKPIPTLYQPLASFDLRTKEKYFASIERSDVCAVPAAAVVGEAMVASVLAQAVLQKFGGDSLGEIKDNYQRYIERGI